jgi:comEA protein
VGTDKYKEAMMRRGIQWILTAVIVTLLSAGLVYAQGQMGTPMEKGRTGTPMEPGKGTGKAMGTAGLIDINTADQAQLEGLKGIGPKKAQDIISYRQKNGPFKSVDELKNVPGIGDKTLAALKPMLTVSR